MLEKSGASVNVINSPGAIASAAALVLPGVGAFDYGISAIRDRGFDEPLNEAAACRRIPVLGICLGMQLMCRSSEEGRLPGLGWIDARVARFPDRAVSGLPVPHMGWNALKTVKPNLLLPFEDVEQRFYFVHSYKIQCNNEQDVVAYCNYGEDFVAAFQKDCLFGVQFHPEKSHRFGLAMMRRFVEWVDAKA